MAYVDNRFTKENFKNEDPWHGAYRLGNTNYQFGLIG